MNDRKKKKNPEVVLWSLLRTVTSSSAGLGLEAAAAAVIDFSL